jgi:polyisoprenoid-binding protein YceI
LCADKHPKITFVSTKIESTRSYAAKIHDDLTMKGVAKPVILDATLIGGYKGFTPYDPNARIGFSAKGIIKCSDFGISHAIPQTESPMGVSDEVEVLIDAEFNGPPHIDSQIKPAP